MRSVRHSVTSTRVGAAYLGRSSAIALIPGVRARRAYTRANRGVKLKVDIACWPALLEPVRRPPVVGRLLVAVRELEETRLVEGAAEEFEPDRQPLVGEPGL